ncbi:MAG: alpha/beta hydrolase family protein [Dorea longicatena]
MNEKTVGMLIGKKNVYEYPELSNAVTCMNYVKKETEIPPVLMMHGLADDLVAPEQSIRLYKKLREEDKEVEFYLVENAKHGDPAFWTEKNMDIVEKFLKAHMN